MHSDASLAAIIRHDLACATRCVYDVYNVYSLLKGFVVDEFFSGESRGIRHAQCSETQPISAFADKGGQRKARRKLSRQGGQAKGGRKARGRTTGISLLRVHALFNLKPASVSARDGTHRNRKDGGWMAGGREESGSELVEARLEQRRDEAERETAKSEDSDG